MLPMAMGAYGSFLDAFLDHLPVNAFSVNHGDILVAFAACIGNVYLEDPTLGIQCIVKIVGAMAIRTNSGIDFSLGESFPMNGIVVRTDGIFFGKVNRCHTFGVGMATGTGINNVTAIDR